MAQSNNTLIFNVKRSEPELVVPEKPTPHEIKYLSDIDDQEGLRFLVPIMFFYPPSVHGKCIEPVKIIREGLAKALVYYYPLAGRLFEGPNRKLMVNCNGEGVLFVEADANVKLEELGDGILPPCPYMEKLLCKVSDSDSGGILGCSLFSFQVTRFICGGLSLGILFNHTMVDGHGLMLFLNAIRELVNGESAPSIPPVWQRELLSARSPPRITCSHKEFDILSNNKLATNPRDDDFILTSVFFGPKEIQSLRNQVQPNQIPSPSRFDLITACLLKCRTIALEPNPSELIRISVVTNARHKKGINLPLSGYYGNAFVYPAEVSTAGILCASPLAYAVDLVRRAKLQLSEEYIRSVADLMVKRGRTKYVTRWNYIVSDITRLGFDEFDLGWGKPLYGGVPSATPVISFYTSSKNAEGEDVVVVSICLPSFALEKFQSELKKMFG
ncbi:hypothetical protein BUALT_Bualt05G0034000 [Buddleja alternifolia]|uniref:Uncharacterized protein n=1 Tax=Buddleja alternifolia TaxID=168488 RepID=A0AAV6XS46_9LAMI|nr:hypothetical protein BUALT_Bualt05G0034000 [Buddleja alternifolia]